MSLPTGFATTADAASAHPLHIVTRDSYAAWRDAQPASVQAWLTAQRFDGSAGSAQAARLLRAQWSCVCAAWSGDGSFGEEPSPCTNAAAVVVCGTTASGTP